MQDPSKLSVLPKLVVFDVDGTLIDERDQVAPETKATIAQLRERDVLVVVATGRPKAIAEETLAQIGATDMVEWMACGNGSIVFNVASGELIRESALPSEVVAPFVEQLRAAVPGVGITIEVNDRMIDEPGFAERVPDPVVAPPVADALAAWRESGKPALRIVPFHDDYNDRLDELVAIAKRFVDDRFDVYSFGGYPILDVSPAGDNKAVAMQALVEHLGLSAADAIAFGDGGNDIELLEWAGVGVAMGNAASQVQAAADHVTDHVNDGGVTAFLGPMLEASRT